MSYTILRPSQVSLLTSISLESPPITILVGPNQHEFFVHASTLERSSEFFKAALKPVWLSRSQRQVKLLEENPQLFRTYSGWLYTGVLSKTYFKLDNSNPKYETVVKLYVLGEKLLDSAFQDELINLLVALCRDIGAKGTRIFPSPDAVSTIYRDTPTESPIRRLVLDMFVSHGQVKWMTNGEYRKDFTMDLCKAFMHNRTNAKDKKEALQQIDIGVPCAYHKHTKETPCKPEVMSKFDN